MSRGHVALVIGQLGYGGGEGQLFHLARALAGTPLKPVVYCLSGRTEPHGRWLRECGIAVRELSLSSDAARTLALARWLRADPPTLVHSFLYIANRYAFLATRLLSLQNLITSARNCKRDPRLGRWLLDRAAFRASRAIVCNSQAVARYIARVYRAPVKRAVVVYNGVRLDHFRPRSCPRPAGPPRVGLVGRITSQKNPELFLSAAAALLRRRPHCQFLVAGDGEGLPAAQRAAGELGIADAVTFLGARLDVAELLRQLDVFWLTSRWEGTPNALLEAMASGIPVVAANVGACSEVIQDGVNGFLVAPGDASAFVHRTEELLDDPAQAMAIGNRARERIAAHFSVQHMVVTMNDLYRRLIQEMSEGWNETPAPTPE